MWGRRPSGPKSDTWSEAPIAISQASCRRTAPGPPGSTTGTPRAPSVTPNIRAAFTKQEREVLDSLDSVEKIQNYIDSLTYDPEDGCRSLRATIARGKAHCMGGALVGCYLLRANLGVE